VSINDATTTEGSGGIFMWNGTPDSVQLADCLVHNNLVYTLRAPAVRFEPSSLNRNFKFYNNIFIGRGDIISGPVSNEKFIGNIWFNSQAATISFRGHPDLSSWANATGQEKINGMLKGKQVDPGLQGPMATTLTDPYQLHTLLQFTLQNNAPLRNRGIDLNLAFSLPAATRDYYGTKLPQGSAPEPGIYEWPEK
jgi:hypothetical protein